MSIRTFIARQMIRAGNLLHALAPMLMRTDDLIEFTRQTYTRPHNIQAWGSQDLMKVGLYEHEKEILQALPVHSGRLLLLGLGGGREAIPLAQMGFEVTGVDFVPGMVEKAKENAARHGVKIEGIVQEISQYEPPAESYDIIWLSSAMYSSVPTRKRRVAMLRRLAKALRPRGYMVCQFHWDPSGGDSRKIRILKKAFALITLGNLAYEKGDRLWANTEFIHSFSSQEDLKSELTEAGFDIIHIYFPNKHMWGWTVLRKA